MTYPTLNTLETPVSQQERITILDSLRGIAILGILLMNIPGFGLPAPLCYGDLSVLNETTKGINFKTWYFIELSVAGTQRALFSMLFGAGIILFIGRKEKSADGLMPAEYFFRRQLWLLFFGLINAFVLLWFWDILFQYAIAGMLLFAFRRLSAKNLIIAAIICLFIQIGRDYVLLAREKKIISTGEMLSKMDTSKIKFTEDQKEKFGAWTSLKEKSTKESKKKQMEKSLRKVRGNYAGFYEYQSERSFNTEVNYTYNGIWDILIFMFIGMALYKNGILLGNAPIKTYWIMTIVGLGLGVFLTRYWLQMFIKLNFDNYQYIKQASLELYELVRTIRSIGILGLILLLHKSGLFKWFFALMRPVGQMAFTNYLMQSLLVGLFFYGIGFGMYGKLQFHQIYYVVAATWLLQIIWSHIWLHFFRFGPLEWAWRSLTYWKLQPMKK